MSLLTLSAKLDRTDGSTPWGFRLHGGKDFGTPLSIQRVTPGSLAAKCGLQVGDVITRIGDSPCDNVFHKEAQSRIMQSGNSLELNLQRGGRSGALSSGGPGAAAAPPPAQQPSAFQSVQPPQPSPVYQNPAPKPFTPGGGGGPAAAGGPGGKVPVAMNMQYNTPINMYSVNNVMDTLATQTATMSVGQDSSPPWSSSKPSGPPSAPRGGGYQAPAAGGGAGGGAPGTWKPNIPAGPRTMKVGRVGDARSMPAASGAVRIPMCGNCGIQIRGPFVSALEKTWCPDHFVCANPQCGCPLIDIGFVEEAGQLFCERDYAQYFAPRCAKCGAAIIGDRVHAVKQTYHPHCFVCCHCRQPITGGSFHMEGGDAYCDKDWAAMFQTKCSGCQFPIEPGDRWVEALSDNWHSECFNCSTCQVNLEGQSFFAKAGKPYCKKHASR